MKFAKSIRVAKCRFDLQKSIQLRKKRELEETKKRNWLDLPPDVMIHIFIKVGVVDLLHSVQKVCSLWRNLAKEPQIFRYIDMRHHWHVFSSRGHQEFDIMVREALSRCRDGELIEFSMEYFGTDEHIHLAIEKANSKLRCLRLVSTSQVSDDALIEITKKNPSLEEIELSLCLHDPEAIDVLCPQLRSFRLNAPGAGKLLYWPDEYEFDFNCKAFAIANNMPQLRRLHLFGNSMTNEGLLAILDKCPHLEYLDLRECFELYLEGDLLQKCVGRVRHLRLPRDSTDDFEYNKGKGARW